MIVYDSLPKSLYFDRICSTLDVLLQRLKLINMPICYLTCVDNTLK